MIIANSVNFIMREFVVIICAVVLGILLLISPTFAGAFLFVGVAILICSQNLLSTLSLFIFLAPYSGMELFNKKFLPVPGAKPFILLSLFIILIAFLHGKKAQKMPRYAMLFGVGVLTILTISTLRSIPHFKLIAPYMEEDNFTLTNYILSMYFKPFFYFMPLILIAKFATTREAIEKIIKVFNVSMFGLSFFLFSMYALKCPNKTSIPATREFFETFMHMHTNSIGFFYSLAFPVLIAHNDVKKGIFNKLNILLCLFVVGILYSRTAYVLVLLSFFSYLFTSKKLGSLPIAIFCIFLALVMLPATVKERAETGISDKDTKAISADRIQGIWMPTFEDYLQSPVKFIVGNGRYSLVLTDAYQKGYVEVEKSPHSLYFEQLFDNGIIGLGLMLMLLFYIGSNIMKNLKYFQNGGIFPKEYIYAVLVSLGNYLLAGVTGQSFYPELANTYLWSILGIGIAMIELNARHKRQGVRSIS